MKWGVFEIKEADPANHHYKVKLLPDDKDFKNPPKFTWLVDDEKFNIELEVVEYDYLLTKDKPEENETLENLVNSNSKKAT